MRWQTMKMLLVPTLTMSLCSCATLVQEGSSTYHRIAALVRADIGDPDWRGNIELRARGTTATAYYVVQEPMTRQPMPMKARFEKRFGKWVLVSTRSNETWFSRFGRKDAGGP